MRLVCYFIALIIVFSCNDTDDHQPEVCPSYIHDWLVTSYDYPSIYRVNDLFFVDPIIGYAIGKFGLIMKTVDGGVSWEVMHLGDMSSTHTSLNLRSSYFFSSLHGYVCGDKKTCCFGEELMAGSVLLETVDGGKSWSKQYYKQIDRFDQIYFFSDLNGIALVTYDSSWIKKFLVTEDGGSAWTEAEIDGSEIQSDHFVTDKHNLYAIGGLNGESNLLLYSSDLGKHWLHKGLPDNNCNRLFLLNGNIYITCGLLFFPETTYVSSDLGESWNQSAGSPFNYRSLVHFSSVNEGLVINEVTEWEDSGGELIQVVSSYEVFRTDDGGENWSIKHVNKSCELGQIIFSVDSETFFTSFDHLVRWDGE